MGSRVLISWEDFKRNPDRYRLRKDLNFEIVDGAGHNLKGILKKVRHEIEGYRCKTLEEVERVANSQGIPIEDLDYKPEILPQSGHVCDVLVKWVPKTERARRAAW